MAKKKRQFYNKLKSKYRLVIMRDATYEEVWFMRLSRLNVITLISSAILLITALVVTLIVTTSLKEMIPGYPDGEMERNIRLNAIKLDSLEYQVYLKDQFIDNLVTIIGGEEPISHESSETEVAMGSQNIQDFHSKEDSLLRVEVESQQQYNFSLFDPQDKQKSLRDLFFFTPLKGTISGNFDLAQKHYGVDIAGKDDQFVKATLDGTILMADYTAETGYVIQIQHDNELVSIYKHNKELLKRPGDLIKAGEAIAIAGNTGELTNGPHLHFELWQKGKPLNPELYISFE